MQRVKNFFIELYYFLTSFVFWKHLFFIFASFALLITFLFWYISWYTLHGETIEVPKITGLSVVDAERVLATRSLKLVVVDERDDDTKPRGTILEQYPLPDQRVKESRTIYLVVNSMQPSMVQLSYDAVIGHELNIVQERFKALRLKVGEVRLVDGKGTNTIAEVRLGERVIFKEANIEKGIQKPTRPAEVPRGSTLTIYVYKGEDNKLRPVPDLLCQTYGAAELAVKGSQFVMGESAFEAGTVDSAMAFVINQDPLPNTMHQAGTPVRLRLSIEKPSACELNENVED